jgi:uncharacterized protein YdiU (UPF0061 family)
MERIKECGFNFDTTYTSLPESFFTQLEPVPVTAPEMVILNNELAQSMGLDFSALDDAAQAQLFSGNQLPKSAIPFAQAYAGHQFGYFTMLGDGRAVTWGEHITPAKKRLDIQFKGSGRTPYSRRGDGRAVLGPMLREYIISEAMHALGIPSTRSLAVATTGEPVLRDGMQPGAILTRVASSHIRVGTFEYAVRLENKSAISELMNYTVQRHYPDLMETENKAMGLLKAVMAKQIDLIVHWMRVGFIHGVMNTDNMTLCGESIDYGPCAFMDAYNPNTVFSSIDQQGRYAYANQPNIAGWNLTRFAETLLPLIHEDISQAIEIAEEVLSAFPNLYKDKWLAMMRAKLGLFGSHQDDEHIISDLLKWLHLNHADYTNTFRDLSQPEKPAGELFKAKGFEAWYQRWQDRREQNAESLEASVSLMRSSNPAVIPRNHKVEEALEAAHQGELKPCHDLLAALQAPYEDDATLQAYQSPPNPSERVYQTFCGT